MNKKSRMKPYDEVPFTNALKHVINPGDSVLIVTTCWKNTHINVGKYLGSRGQGRNLSVVVAIDEKKNVLVHNETGEEWKWNTTPPGLVRPECPSYPVLNWGISAVERTRIMDEYNKKYKEYQSKNEDFYPELARFKSQNYHQKIVPYVRYSTLQLNRIYPINMPSSELVNVRL